MQALKHKRTKHLHCTQLSKHMSYTQCEVEQTARLPEVAGAQEVTMQDQRGVSIEAIKVTLLKLHEIWQVEGK